FDNAPLHALADGVDGANGVYAYGANGTFPVNSFNSANYWVDVVFAASTGPDTTPPTVAAVTPANGATGVNATVNAAATFNEAMDASTITTGTFELRDPSAAVVPATVTYDAASRTATLDPTAANLPYLTTFTAKVRGGAGTGEGAAVVKDVAGNAM